MASCYSPITSADNRSNIKAWLAERSLCSLCVSRERLFEINLYGFVFRNIIHLKASASCCLCNVIIYRNLLYFIAFRNAAPLDCNGTILLYHTLAFNCAGTTHDFSRYFVQFRRFRNWFQCTIIILLRKVDLNLMILFDTKNIVNFFPCDLFFSFFSNLLICVLCLRHVHFRSICFRFHFCRSFCRFSTLCCLFRRFCRLLRCFCRLSALCRLLGCFCRLSALCRLLGYFCRLSALCRLLGCFRRLSALRFLFGCLCRFSGFCSLFRCFRSLLCFRRFYAFCSSCCFWCFLCLCCRLKRRF